MSNHGSAVKACAHYVNGDPERHLDLCFHTYATDRHIPDVCRNVLLIADPKLNRATGPNTRLFSKIRRHNLNISSDARWKSFRAALPRAATKGIRLDNPAGPVHLRTGIGSGPR
ncbi:hypothetical protein SBA4_1520003 [Candidatus Sulfopaludibacter sp. SbA4]|nr:hypothetical protein SBA4_1520003 [Candidatus Sulfopaludibacter sp. SbA4]